ncbi:hypothetical protein NLM59_10100 [Weeksellaceae bacterium KMM 9724]|uniref:hypothetical protein n=1 Tax=Profundicola chukchiensis TaxID=2961959 RepID=UPI00243EED47|nr:hypothetical protein [Profundicola chukchiensis]MDG4951279.1 hypothetical protein [Profundicola chukchiensis]
MSKPIKKKMNIKNKALAINSTLIVVSTTIIGTILHELAHFLMAKYFELNPELHHNYVNYLTENATEFQKAIIAGIGPVFSLIFGIIILLISVKILKPSLLKLFMLWLGMNGILMFLGYILIAPIVKNGDTGQVFDFLNIPTFISVVIAVISFVIIIKLFSSLSKEFRFYKNEDLFVQKENEKQLFFYPIWFSIIFITILSLPVVTWISLLPTIFMPMTYFSTMKKYRKQNLENAELEINFISKPLLILTIGTIIIFRILI